MLTEFGVVGETESTFEIFVHGATTKALVYRSYDDFAHWHVELSALFPLDHVGFPRRRHRFGLALAPDTLRIKLNSYLHRLLEIPGVHESAVFQSFFQERPTDIPPSPTKSHASSFNTQSNSYEDPLSSSRYLQYTSKTFEALVKRSAGYVLPKQPPPRLVCCNSVLYGQPMHWSACGGLSLAPSSHLHHTITLHSTTTDSFVAESATALSSAGRSIQYGDICRLRSSASGSYLTVRPNGKVSLSSTAGSVFRFVSLFDHGTSVLCGAPVCLQVVEQGVQPRWLSVHKDCLIASDVVAPVTIRPTVASCVHPTKPSGGKAMSVRVLAYNVWFLPQVATKLLKLSPFKGQRAHAIPQVLPEDLDLVVFCEAFDAKAKQILVTEMKRRGFLYETRTAGGKNPLKAFNSGVFCMSRYPLEHYDELLYGGNAVADERLADKAAIYVQMHKRGEIVHVVATHTQAWETPGAIACRARQIQMVARWIAAKKIPKHDILLYAGDFNIDMNLKPPTEYTAMLETLDATNPETKSALIYSFDPTTNKLATSGMSSGGRQERLDYVMYGSSHRRPKTAWTQVLPLKDKAQRDLSDHYPVLSEFHFE